MNCDKAHTIIQNSLDGNSSETLGQSFLDHLRNCQSCSVEYAILEKAYVFMEEEKAKKAPEFLADSVLSELSRQKRPHVRSAFYVLRQIAAIFILGISILGGILAGNQIYQTEEYEYEAWASEFDIYSDSYTDDFDNLFEISD